MRDELNPDDQIIKGVIQGDIDDFRLIVNRYKDKIFSIGMRFLNNEDDSYDFVQEVFIKAYHNLKSFKGLAPFRFWLTKIAYNHGVNRIKAMKEERGFSEESISAYDTPEKDHFNVETKDLLLEAINKLPEQYRISLDFYFFWGLSYKQINAITGLPINTIKSDVYRAKRILRDALRGTIAEDYHEM